MDMTAGIALAAAPFLPAGKGPLILMLGGLGMLSLSLFFVRRAPLVAPVAARRLAPLAAPVAARPRAPRTAAPPALPQAAPRRSPSEAYGLDAGTAWVAGLVAELGHGRIVTADQEHCVVFVTQCVSCQQGRNAHGCEGERQAVQSAARQAAPQASVSELFCNPSGQSACTFTVERYGAR